VLTSPDQPVDYATPPVDSLDALFRFHDMAYDSPNKLDRAKGDLALIQGLVALSPDGQSLEATLYTGGAILFGIQQLTQVNDHPELLGLPQLLAAANAAFDDIRYGLTHLEPDDAVGLQSWLSRAGSGSFADLLPLV
jgi:hypothetical protein